MVLVLEPASSFSLVQFSSVAQSCPTLRPQGQEGPLEEGMVTHSSILVWRIPMDRGAWWATAHRVTKSQTHLKRFSMHSTHALNPTSWKKD